MSIPQMCVPAFMFLLLCNIENVIAMPNLYERF